MKAAAAAIGNLLDTAIDRGAKASLTNDRRGSDRRTQRHR
jgi:hypothetical protein